MTDIHDVIATETDKVEASIETMEHGDREVCPSCGHRDDRDAFEETAYIEREGRQFGLEERVRVKDGAEGNVVIHEIDGSIWAFSVTRCRLWALFHGYGWLKVRG